MMIVISVFAVLIVIVLLFTFFAPQLGQKPEGADLERVEKSSHYTEGRFQNDPRREISMTFRDSMSILWRHFRGGAGREPDKKLPSESLHVADMSAEPYLTWFGHSTFFYEVSGKKILFDPMLGENASPLPGPLGVPRYDYDLPATAESIPALDYVIISHDHYDHLDYRTVQKLAPKVGMFLAPLGVGSHLKRWGIPAEQIREFDWGDAYESDGVIFRAVASQHFSGRSTGDRMKTLWAAWIIEDADTKVFFGGDSGYFPGFVEHGEQYGPFDLTLLDSAQYNDLWKISHMIPEESVQAHQDLRGKRYMPIHWSSFTLALHPWTEPVERALAEAEKSGVEMITPMIGERFHVRDDLPQKKWWRE